MNKLYSVHDHWTDINKKNDVDIESIDGVITGIKVNGEDYGGESDFSIAKVTIINNMQENAIRFLMPTINEAPVFTGTTYQTDLIVSQQTKEASVILYKNKGVFAVMDFGTYDPEPDFYVTGSIEYEGGGEFIITGDGTVTISQH